MASKLYVIALLLSSTTAKYFHQRNKAPLSDTELAELSQPLESHHHHHEDAMMMTDIEENAEIGLSNQEKIHAFMRADDFD